MSRAARAVHFWAFTAHPRQPFADGGGKVHAVFDVWQCCRLSLQRFDFLRDWALSAVSHRRILVSLQNCRKSCSNGKLRSAKAVWRYTMPSIRARRAKEPTSYSNWTAPKSFERKPSSMEISSAATKQSYDKCTWRSSVDQWTTFNHLFSASYRRESEDDSE